MHILVTGNQGYIGTILTKILMDQGYEVTGFDIGYYADCQLEACNPPHQQITKDIRELETSDLAGIDAVIHLAALSNDPLGELAPGLTEEINFGGTIRLAKLAKEKGIKRFVYSSSQSMYGISDTEEELEELASSLEIEVKLVKDRARTLHEFNPMLGHRGCRLGISFPEIYEMQCRAIFEAIVELKKQKVMTSAGPTNMQRQRKVQNRRAQK